MKYSKLGDYEVSYEEHKSDNKSIKKVRVWYPKTLENNSEKYPMIVVVNASGVPAFRYEPFFKRLASWGFIVVGNEDGQTGTGETTSITLDYMLNISSDSKLYNKIDKENIGIIGYSQGGAGALRALTEFENGYMTQGFAFGGEEGMDKFDPNVKYRSSLQNYLIDTGDEVILVDTGLPKESPEIVPDENTVIYVGTQIKDYVTNFEELGYTREQVTKIIRFSICFKEM